MTARYLFQKPGTRALALSILVLLGAAAVVAQQRGHVHGRAELDVAVDAGTIAVHLDSPLDSLLGFERAPRTDAERKRAADLVGRLMAADTLFVIDPAAQCKLASVKLESAVLGLGAGGATPHSHGKGDDHDSHADLDMTALFTCTNAAAARFVDVKLFEAFPRYRGIDAQVAAPAGQFKRTLTKAAPRLSW